MKPKRLLCRFIETRPIAARRFEQGVGAHDIGLDKVTGAIDRTIDMRLSREVHHRIGLVIIEHSDQSLVITDIHLLEAVTLAVRNRRQ